MEAHRVRARALDWRYFALFCTFLGGMGQGVVSPQFPKLLAGEELIAFESGLSATLMYFGIFITSFFFGSFADRGGVHRLLGLGLLGYAVTLVLFSLSPSFYVLLGIRFAEGIALSAVFVASDFLLGRLSQDKERGQWLSYYGVALSLGLLAGPLLTLGLKNFSISLWSVAGCAMILSSFAFSFLRVLKLSEKSDLTPIKVLQFLEPLSGGFAYGAMEASLVAVLPVLALGVLHLPPEHCLIAIILSAALASVPWGMASDKFGSKLILRVILSLLVFGPFVVYQFFPGFGICLLLGVIAGGLYPVSFSRLLELMPKEKYGAASGGFTRWYGMGSLVGPLLSGVLTQLFGLGGLLGCISFVGFAALGIGFLSVYSHKE